MLSFVPSRHWRSLAVLAVATALAATVVWLATRAEGQPGTRASTNDGGAWLLNREAGAIGHMNREVLEVTAAVRVAQPGSDFDVDQAGDVILVHDRTSDLLTLIDGRTHQRRGELAVPTGVSIQALASGAVISQSEPFAVWQVSIDQLLSVTDLATVAPLPTPAGSGAAVVGQDGQVRFVEQVEATVIGGDVVELASLAVDGLLQPAVLQQPSPARDGVVLIDAGGRLIDVGLDGVERTTVDLDGADPLPPIVHNGCIFAVTRQPSPRFHRVCGDGAVGDSVLLDGTGSELRLRLVNGWVWINDLSTGGGWVTSGDAPLRRVDDWGAALADDEDENRDATVEDGGGVEELRINPDSEDAELIDADEEDEDDDNEPPIARDDQSATRADRPVLIPVTLNDEDPDGDVLLISEVSLLGDGGQQAQLAIAPSQSAVQLSPSAGFVGTVQFSYTITDGRGGSDSAVVTVEVVANDPTANRPPIPTTDVVAVRAGSSVVLNVLDNDRDPDGDSLILSSIINPSGNVVFGPDGSVSFTPDATDAEGQIELGYIVSDELGATAQGRILVNVRLRQANSPPDARNDSLVTTVGNSVTTNVLDNDHDPDGDPLIVASQIDQPGVLLTPDGEFSFDPSEAGVFLFEYLVSDGQNSDRARIRVDVSDTTENRAPVAVRDDVAIPAGQTRLISVLANDGDPDGDVVGIVSWSGVEGLQIEEVPGIGFRVTVDPDAPPTRIFRYSISDGVNEPVSTTVVVSVIEGESVNQPPVAEPDSVEVRAGQSTVVSVLGNDHDPEGGALRILAAPELAGIDVQFELGPDGQTIIVIVGDDVTTSFTFGYEIGDEGSASAATVVEVRVIPATDPNRAPIARSDIGRAIAGKSVDIPVLANDSDPDGDPIRIESVATQPRRGTLIVEPAGLDAGTIRYEPDPGFTGTDEFRYVVVDSGGARAIGTVLVGVVPATQENRAPSANDDQYTLAYGTAAISLDVLANDIDPDNDPLTIISIANTAPGVTARIVGANVVITPPTSTDRQPTEVSFVYSVSDGRGESDDAVVMLRFEHAPTPLPPVAFDDQVGPVSGSQTIEISPLINDLDPDGDVADLILSSTDPDVRVIGDRLEIDVANRSSQYRYMITDADGLSDTALVNVFVVDNRAPTITPIEVETDHNASIEIDLASRASDPDGDALFFVCCDNVRGGSTEVIASGEDQMRIRFTPSPGSSGRASFSFSVDDQAGHLVSGGVAVLVAAPSNRSPEVVDGRLRLEAGRTVPFDLTNLATDPDPGDSMTYETTAGAGLTVAVDASGQAQISAGLTAGGQSSDVSVTVTDRSGSSATGRIIVEITEVSAPLPRAINDQETTNQGQAVSVAATSNDIDPLGRGLTVTQVIVNGGATIGSAVAQGGEVTFTPHNEFFGTAVLTYTIRDGAAQASREAIGQISIGVVGRPGTPAPPVANADDAKATLTWRTPDANGATITAYELTIENVSTGQARTVSVSSTTHLASDLRNGDLYRFRIRAKNSAGWSEWSAWSAEVRPNTTPDSPSRPTVAFGDRQLGVTWTPPTNLGSPITGYRLEIGGGTSEVVDLGATLGYEWRELTNGVEYQFRVAAVNDAGDSDWSAWSNSEHPFGPPRTPGVPTVSRGDRFLDIDWVAPGSNGDPIAGYDLEIRSSGRVVQVVGAGTTEYRWGDLTNGVAQEFRVRADNRWPQAGEWSGWSAPVVPCDVPLNPARPTVVGGDGQVVVSWVAPDNQGCAITQYRITASGGPAQGGAVRTTGGGSTQLVYDGLSNGSPYTFSVAAINEVGISRASEPSAGVIPAGRPTAPSISSAAPESVGSITVRFAGADGNGAAITSHEISINGANGSTATSPHVLSGLQPNTAYEARVRACNEIGCGPWSAPRTASTWGPPSQVALSATSGNATLTANWTAPADTGGSAITGYEISRSPGPAGFDAGSPGLRSATWSDVVNGQSYTVTVRACNQVGCGPYASASATPIAPPRTVVLSRGSPYSGPGCTHPSCSRLAVNAQSFGAGENLTIVCHDTQIGAFRIYYETADSNGNSVAERCYFGFPGEGVWVTVNGVRSNTITWPDL